MLFSAVLNGSPGASRLSRTDGLRSPRANLSPKWFVSSLSSVMISFPCDLALLRALFWLHSPGSSHQVFFNLTARHTPLNPSPWPSKPCKFIYTAIKNQTMQSCETATRKGLIVLINQSKSRRGFQTNAPRDNNYQLAYFINLMWCNLFTDEWCLQQHLGAPARSMVRPSDSFREGFQLSKPHHRTD